jgi:hypothetical protein
MFYVAYHRDTYIFAAPSFAEVVKFVRARLGKDRFAHDCVIWSGPRVAAIVGPTGAVVEFPVPPPSPTSPPAA